MPDGKQHLAPNAQKHKSLFIRHPNATHVEDGGANYSVLLIPLTIIILMVLFWRCYVWSDKRERRRRLLTSTDNPAAGGIELGSLNDAAEEAAETRDSEEAEGARRRHRRERVGENDQTNIDEDCIIL